MSAFETNTPPAPDLGPLVACANCGAPALTVRQFVAAANRLGFSVDPITGVASYATVAPVLPRAAGLPLTEGEKQFEYDVVQGRRGFVCQSCGSVHCASCLMRSPDSPVTGGPRCPTCDLGPHGLFDS